MLIYKEIIKEKKGNIFMKKFFNLFILTFAMAITISHAGICAEAAAIKNINPVIKVNAKETTPCVQAVTVNPLDLVANPQTYLNKKIKMTSQFDKFSTIGLDYPPVNRSSKDYISFIIKRPDVENKDYTIPFSELKLIIKRDKAEKLIDLESGDKIEITGTVFSAALGDPWVDVDEVKMLEIKPTVKTKK